jgi:hypothetical protein
LAEASAWFQVSYRGALARCCSDGRSSGCFELDYFNGSQDFDHDSINDFLLILAVEITRYDMAALRALER